MLVFTVQQYESTIRIHISPYCRCLMFGNWEAWVFHLCFSFSKRFWLSCLIIFTQVLVSACQFLQITQPGYWYSLQGTCRSFWGKILIRLNLLIYEQDVFLCFWIFFSFFQQCFVVYSAQVLHFWLSLFLHVLKCSHYCSVKSQKREMVNDLASPIIAQVVKDLPAVQQTWVWILGGEDPLEK